jgi:biotin synthase-related radical SAM superfamily protein
VFFSLSHLTYRILYGKKVPFPMETAYVLVGDTCRNHCLFCSFSVKHRDNSKKWLSRVSWQKIDVEEFISRISTSSFKRICFQLACSRKAIEFMKEILLKHSFSQDISLSCWLDKYEEMEFFFARGVKKLALNLDVVGENHSAIKGGKEEKKLEHILKASEKYPGKITTHLIVGCGETDKEITEVIDLLVENQVTVSLFPYTPFKGLPRSDLLKRPELKRYRLLQLYLCSKILNLGQGIEWNWEGKWLSGIKNISEDFYQKLIHFEQLFMTIGCQFCTRPFYNDSPSQKELYNYHYPLNITEKEKILRNLLSKNY